MNSNATIPVILSPAGNRAAFLAALAAGADALYCGLKSLSARMEAKNFTVEELAALTELAHAQGCRVHVAFNTQLTTGELEAAGKLLSRVQRHVKPDALIIQDLGMLALVRRSGYDGEVNLSTLSGVTFARALALMRGIHGIDQLVLPRELNIDEIKQMAAVCPPGLGLEVFIHGALCYGISGRCYWSSYLGGKSSLRGRCVQPCRRRFSQAGADRRFFSNQDLSLDVLVKVLKGIPEVKTWKIEGRKKGPHYVYYTVSAYRMLRDEGADPKMKKAALELLERALGRRGTHFHFLPQRPQNPIDPSQPTGSGMLIGRLKGSSRSAFITSREPLLRGDRLRIGYEDQAGHTIIRVGRAVPAGGRFVVKSTAKRPLAKGMPVFLTDRREPALVEKLAAYEERLVEIPPSRAAGREPRLELNTYKPPAGPPFLVTVRRDINLKKGNGGHRGLWLQPKALSHIQPKEAGRIWWWLPPVIWPSEEAEIAGCIKRALNMGAVRFVLNSAWQIGFFENSRRLTLWAGPFCNLANALALESAAALGFKGAIVSPEMGKEDYFALPQHSPVPLGLIIQGFWPLTISRYIADDMKTGQPFTSQKGEQAWVSRYSGNYWVFPNWRVDLTSHIESLKKAGYRMFVYLNEPVPKAVRIKKRPGLWNWKGQLK